MENQYVKTAGGSDIGSLIKQVDTGDSGFFLCFYGAGVAADQIYNALKGSGKPFLGCMDAGRFIEGGYKLDEDSIVLMGLSEALFDAVAFGLVDMSPDRSDEEIRRDSESVLQKAAGEISLDLFNPDMGREFIINLLYGLNSASSFLEGQGRAAFMLQSVGGSSGGRLDFKDSNVISHLGKGACGVFALIRLKKEFGFVVDRVSSFKKLEGKELKVTKIASPRHILEFNGKKATEEYSHILGIDKKQLSPEVYASFTLGIEPGDNERLITSIMDKDSSSEGFLTYNDVVEGTCFNLFEAVDQSPDRSRILKSLAAKEPVVFISFDCILCYLARNTPEKVHTIAELYQKSLPKVPKIGFGTFSENICGANINQTETFLAIYKC